MCPAEAIYRKLISENIQKSCGKIEFKLSDINLEIKDISIVGNVLQEWLECFMLKHNIFYRKKDNSQEFPDFLLDKNSDTINLLEVKSFTKSPNFDIANFSAYAKSLRTDAYRLNSKYLIFKYSVLDDKSTIKIDNVWLKNVWEICSASGRSNVKIQWKHNDPVNIRPCVWYSDKVTYRPFETRKKFVEALNKVIGTARLDTNISQKWLNIVSENYKYHTGKDL